MVKRIGNSQPNRLLGTSAADFLAGLGGNDTLTGLNGEDSLEGGLGHDWLIGGSSLDGLFGAQGNDFLDGGLGEDILVGGAGNDTYVVDDRNDLVTEKRINTVKGFLAIQTEEDLLAIPDAGGNDWVRASITYYLRDDFERVGNVENLELVGQADLIGGGNKLDNVLLGNAGGNTLIGLDGDDYLQGNEGDDLLVGNNDHDVLYGGKGFDVLRGGPGFDGFLFGSKRAFVATDLNFDSILDFRQGEDLIALSDKTFNTLNSNPGNGLTAAGDFATVAQLTQAATSHALIVFSRQGSTLFYNPNRSAAGFGTGGAFALVSEVTALSGATSFLVIDG